MKGKLTSAHNCEVIAVFAVQRGSECSATGETSNEGMIAISGTENHHVEWLDVLGSILVLSGVKVGALQEHSELSLIYNGTLDPSLLLFQVFLEAQV